MAYNNGGNSGNNRGSGSNRGGNNSQSSAGANEDYVQKMRGTITVTGEITKVMEDLNDPNKWLVAYLAGAKKDPATTDGYPSWFSAGVKIPRNDFNDKNIVEGACIMASCSFKQAGVNFRGAESERGNGESNSETLYLECFSVILTKFSDSESEVEAPSRNSAGNTRNQATGGGWTDGGRGNGNRGQSSGGARRSSGGSNRNNDEVNTDDIPDKEEAPRGGSRGLKRRN